MSATPRRTTILDIAREAGVSTATVSRVLNNLDYPVKEQVRRDILKVAEKLNYRPNIFSQMLKGGVNKFIGIILPNITNPFYSQLVADVETHCIAAGYVPMICSSYNSTQLEQNHLETLLRHQVAGIILSTISTNAAFIKRIGSISTPCVLFDQLVEGFTGDYVSFDFRRGGHMATRHLVDNGHVRIAIASSPFDRSSRRLIYEGYQDALRECGLRLNMSQVFVADADKDAAAEMRDYACGRILAQQMLAAPYLPDAVLAINDIIAIGIVNALRENNIQVPSDLSVHGFDDILFSSMVAPALTTIRQSTIRTAEAAVRILLRKIKNPALPSTSVIVEPELVERASVRKIHPRIRRRA